MYAIAMDATMEMLLDDAALDALASHGITHLSVPFALYDLDIPQLQSRAQALKSRGLRVITCHLPYGANNREHSTCAEDDAVFGQTIAMWQHYLRRFAYTGLVATPMHTGGCMHPALPSRLRDRLTDTLSQLLPIAQASGVIIALENTFYPNPPGFSGMDGAPIGDFPRLNDDCALLAEYVKGWNHPNIQACLDVGHTNIFGHDVMTDMKLLTPYLSLLHLHDNDGTRDAHYTPGQGTIPWPEVAQQLKAIDYQGALYAEILNDPDPQIAAQGMTLPRLVAAMHTTRDLLTV